MRLISCLSSVARVTPFYVTTPIFYVNASPHLGHAYSAVVADAAARVQQLLRPKVYPLLSSGTDEHGTKVECAAGDTSLQQFCDNVSAQYQVMLKDMEVQYGEFVRTTQIRHRKAVRKFWRQLDKSGHIYKAHYSGWYSVSDESFVPESQTTLERRSGNEVRVSVESGHPVEWMEEENYMFRLSAFREHLLDWLRQDGVITPSKYQEQLVSILRDNYLPDVSVSRPISRVSWSIPVPDDDDHGVYVWLDALVNYLTAVGYPEKVHGWPADLHVVGKDILKFHGIYWPAFLMAAGLHPPRRLLCHGHWTVEGRKMSKSVGNVVAIDSAPVPPAALRYFILREATMHSDANYSETKLVRTVNAELADSLGNLLARCTRPALNPASLWPSIHPQCVRDLRATTANELCSLLERLPDECRRHYEEYHFYRAADACIAVLHAANATFDAEAPWKLIKSDQPRDAERLETVLHVTMEALRVVGVFLGPLAPSVSRALLDKLAVPESDRTFESTLRLSYNAAPSAARPLSAGNTVLFQRVYTEKPASKPDSKPSKSQKNEKVAAG